MMKSIFILLLAVGFSLQNPVEDVPEELLATSVRPGEEVEPEELPEFPEFPEFPEIPEMNPDGECPDYDDEFPTYLSDTQNCSVFYQCANGIPFRMSCTYPLEFNPTLNVCDFPGRSGCMYDKRAPYTMIGRCPPFQSPGLKKVLRDSTDKTIYYECVNGQAIKRQCPPNTEFTFKKQCEPVAEEQ